jgi:nucleoside-diphosphate-sugar epimerase
VRDFVSVGDAVEMFVRVADRAVDLRGEVLNCGSGHATTLGELVDTVERTTGVAIDANWGAFPVAPHDLRHPIAATAAARHALGWHATTTLDEVIEQLWQGGTPVQSPPAGPARSR